MVHERLGYVAVQASVASCVVAMVNDDAAPTARLAAGATVAVAVPAARSRVTVGEGGIAGGATYCERVTLVTASPE